MKEIMQKYFEAAKEFAKVAMDSSTSSVVIQNAHKSVEFALSVYALEKGQPLPRDHWQSSNLAYKINKEFGKKFSALLRIYLGAYRLEDGEKAKEAKSLMNALLRELGEYVKKNFLP